MLSRRTGPRRRQAGLSLVEMLIGITVGLFIVGAATMVITTQLGDNRRLLLETQLQQDLRASADIMAREIRRAGSWAAARESVWYPGRTSEVSENPKNGLFAVAEDGSGIDFEYQRPRGAEGPWGFRLTTDGVIQSRLGQAGWQDLTDSRVMQVTGLQFQLQESPSDPLPCPRLCDDGGTACWPRLVSRAVQIDIAATSRTDPSIARTVSTTVRLRNDVVEFNGASVCP